VYRRKFGACASFVEHPHAYRARALMRIKLTLSSLADAWCSLSLRVGSYQHCINSMLTPSGAAT